MSLWADFLTNDERLIHKWKHYFPIYERHLTDQINKSTTLIEIGCGMGGSLQMWKRFLGPHATIVGIDIHPDAAAFAEDQIEIRIGDQADTAFLDRVLQEFGTPDVVLDDASHRPPDQTVSFRHLYPRLSKNGIYIVEDLHAAYWEEYGGGLRHPDNFIELCKSLVDELNADHTRGALTPTDFTRTTMSICFYDSVIVFERGAYTRKLPLQVPRPP